VVAACETVRVDQRAELAARNNADWCDLVCRTHGLDTTYGPDAWLVRRRSPPLYPDAVTLRERLPAADLLSRLDSSTGCSIKDSFASFDLSGDGFRPLFAAEWIYRRPGGAPAEPLLSWSVVRTADELLAWAAAHGGGETFRPALLADPAVAILAARDGDELVAGVIGNRSESVVGLSNLFTRRADPEQVWAEATGAVRARFPGLPVVGYEHGTSLELAQRTGFVSVGPLRVWLRD
jgi:hypothetical protein